MSFLYNKPKPMRDGDYLVSRGRETTDYEDAQRYMKDLKKLGYKKIQYKKYVSNDPLTGRKSRTYYSVYAPSQKVK